MAFKNFSQIKNAAAQAVKAGKTANQFVNQIKKFKLTGQQKAEILAMWNTGKDFINQVRGVFLNNPIWYSNIDTHILWSIPYGVSEEKLLPYAAGITRASVAVIDLCFNDLAAVNQQSSRASKDYNILKSARGLSGALPYDIQQIVAIKNFNAAILNEYGRLKFCIRLSYFYNFLKGKSVPTSLLRALGFNPSDFTENLALYESLLCKMYNYISQHVFTSSYINDLLFHSWAYIVPDSDEGIDANYIKTNMHVCVDIKSLMGDTYFPEANYFKDMFKITSADDPYYTMDPLITYSEYVSNWEAFTLLYDNTPAILNFNSDMLGAFGDTSTFADSDIDKVRDKYYLDPRVEDIVGKYDELYLQQLMNGTLCHASAALKLDSGSNIIIDTNETKIKHVTDINGNMFIQVLGTYQLAEDDNADSYFIPPSDYSSASIGQGPEEVPNTVVVSYKTDATEAEQLEMTALMSIRIRASVGQSGATVTTSADYVTHPIFIGGIRVIVPSKDVIINLDVPMFLGFGTGYAAAQNKVLVKYIQYWSQIRGVPKLPVCVYSAGDVSGNNVDNAGLLLDTNVVGTLSKDGLATGIDYSTYSLYGMTGTVTATKAVAAAKAYGYKMKA